jgi:uncharacterized protein (TIGR02757 family)
MAHQKPVRRREILRQRLDTLVATFDFSHLTPDPLELAYRYREAADREVAGFLAACFAYGRADVVVRNVGGVLDRMDPSPSRFLREQFTPRRAAKSFAGFSHRFHKTGDLVALLAAMSAALRRHGSLGALFESLDDPASPDVSATLDRFADALVSFSRHSRGVELDEKGERSLRYLVSSPRDGSACKRMNLFLRWMVRRTSPDLGIWTFVDPSRLVMPLDTHVHRIATFLGLTTSRTANWRTARGLTDSLARFDAADPVRYDFAICRLGILDLCSRRRRKENCDVCLLRDVCRFPVLTEREVLR